MRVSFSKLKSEYHKIQVILIVIFLAVLPFNAILQTVIGHKLQLPFFSYFKEILLFFILLINLIDLTNLKTNLKNWLKNLKDRLSENKTLIYLSLVYLAWITVSLAWKEDQQISSFIYGFKYDGIIILCLLAGITIPTKTKKYVLKLIKYYYYSLITAFAVGLFLHFVITPENLTILGFRNDWSTFYSNQALAFCQKIENFDMCRFQGTFSGPNQAAANAILGLAILGLVFSKFKLNKSFLILSGILLITGLTFSFSRSSWLALIVFSTVLIALKYKEKLLKLTGYLTVLILVSFVAVINFAPETVLRYESNSERVELMQTGLTIVKESPFIGYGIGYSGPASHFSANTIITENWFLQVLINYGVIGLILFIGIYYFILSRLYKKKAVFFLALMISLLIPLNLLHYFEDSSFSYALFLILGLILSRE